jgi:hypothetical protein
MDQNTVLQVLDVFIDRLEEEEMDRAHALWLFALLVLVEKPLLPDTAASLNSLLNTCLRLRNDLMTKGDESVTLLKAPLNILIIVTAKYFEQRPYL